MTGNPDTRRALAVPASRLARLTRLGSMTAGVAGNMAVQGMSQLARGRQPVMRDLLLTPGNIRRITDQLAHMRGAAMKIGQLMSMDSGDVLPPELAEIMSRLRSQAHFMPPAQLKKILNANWPAGWIKAFERFDVRPIAAASIGQVHRARLRDGREMAIKVQYPGVAGSIDSDVSNVGALIRMSGLTPSGFDLAPYLEEARKQLHEETDYLREGRHLAHFASLLASDDRFDVPVQHEDWTTPGILAMSFVRGAPIEDLRHSAQERRDQVASDLIDLMLSEMFSFGVMQTDPNFANYLWNEESGRIILLDFGASRPIDPTIATLYRRLFVAGLADDRQTLREVATEIGFLAPDGSGGHADQIMRMIAMVFDELRRSPNLDFAETTLPRALQAEGQTEAAYSRVNRLLAAGDAGQMHVELRARMTWLQARLCGINKFCVSHNI